MDGKDLGKNGRSKEVDDSLKAQKESGTWHVGLKENDTWHVDLKESDIIKRVAPKETNMWGVGKGKGSNGSSNGGEGGSSNGGDLILGLAAVAVMGWGLYTIFRGPPSPTEEKMKEKMMKAPGGPPSPIEEKKKEKMMKAPGRPGVDVPRNPFEENTKDYFSNLRKEKKKR